MDIGLARSCSIASGDAARRSQQGGVRRIGELAARGEAEWVSRAGPGACGAGVPVGCGAALCDRGAGAVGPREGKGIQKGWSYGMSQELVLIVNSV